MAYYADDQITSLRAWQRSMRRHRSTLKEILASTGKFPTVNSGSLSPCRQSSKEFHRWGMLYTALQRSIQTSNRHLLKHLVAISLRGGGTPKRIPHGQSLNSAMRKRQERDISRDNDSLVSRLNSRKSCFSAEKWDEEYQQSRKYCSLIAKPHIAKSSRRQANTASGRKKMLFPWELQTFDS